jgi:hypothetical protein
MRVGSVHIFIVPAKHSHTLAQLYIVPGFTAINKVSGIQISDDPCEEILKRSCTVKYAVGWLFVVTTIHLLAVPIQDE